MSEQATTEAPASASNLPTTEADWQQVALLLILKLAGRNNTVTLKADHLQKLLDDFKPGAPVLFTHEHLDGISLTVMDQATAQRAAAQG